MVHTLRTLHVALLLSFTAGLLSAGSARAEPPSPLSAADEARGRELYENGALLYEEGRYEDAIYAWEEGYRLTERGAFLFNIANAQERLGRYSDALDTLGRYRALARADEREVLDRRIRNLEGRLVEAPAPVPGPAPAPVPAPVPMPSPVPVDEPGGGRTGRTVAGTTMAAAGAVGLVVGTVFGLRSRAAGQEASALCVDATAGRLCPITAAPALRSSRRSALVADLGLLSGVLVGAGGAVVLLTGRGDGWDVSVPLVVHGRF